MTPNDKLPIDLPTARGGPDPVEVARFYGRLRIDGDASVVYAPVVASVHPRERAALFAQGLADLQALRNPSSSPYTAVEQVDNRRLADYQGLRREMETLAVLTDAGQPLAVEPVPDFLLHMVRAGGLMAVLRQRAESPNPRSPHEPTRI